MTDLEQGVWASVPSLIIRPCCKMAEQAFFLEERVDCTALRSLFSTKLNRRALNEPLLPLRGGSEVLMLAALTNHESEGRSISFSLAHLACLFIEACEEMARGCGW